MSECPPVLFLAFNRPELARRVFAEVRAAKPSRLYVAMDGPRAGRNEDYILINQTRQCIESMIDWPCVCKKLYREINLGCAQAVSEAITWFFNYESYGVFIEDDCLCDLSFFQFCSELLEKYKDESQIGHIGGNTFLGRREDLNKSYYFSCLNHIWGWATWKRAWEKYDHAMKMWPVWKQQNMLYEVLPNENAVKYWHYKFDMAHSGEIDSWGYRWTFSCWVNGFYSILPKYNIVQNIGFGNEATHTKNANSKNPADKLNTIEFPMTHPKCVQIDRDADQLVMKKYYRLNFSIRRILRKFIKKQFPKCKS